MLNILNINRRHHIECAEHSVPLELFRFETQCNIFHLNVELQQCKEIWRLFPLFRLLPCLNSEYLLLYLFIE